MSTFSSRELYLMNGGNKIYLYRDGFGDVYNASPAEEAEWAKEVVEGALAMIDMEMNPSSINRAIDNLLFHNYPGVKALLLKKSEDPIPLRQVLFATALWRIFQYEPSVEILLNHAHTGSEGMNSVFLCLGDFKDNAAARKFILACIKGDDEVSFVKANMTIGVWAYSGIPALRENNLLEALRPENKNKDTFKPALEQLEQILGGH